MKKILLIIAVALISASSYGQAKAKKPTIMVVPSDRMCISAGYSMKFDNQGTEVVLPDYKKAFQTDASLRLVITKMSGIMADRGFPLKDLEAEMKKLEQEAAEVSMMTSKSGSMIAESPIDALKRTAKADIIMEIDYEVKQQGPRQYITFNLKGLDAYTSKAVATAAGTGAPSTAAPADLLLEEAVLSHMDEFNGRLMAHFEDMFTNGREVRINVMVFDGWGEDLETEFDVNGETDELNIFIEDWMAENTVQGRFSLSDGSATMMRFEQVRTPLFYERNGKERAMDTKQFVTSLRKHLGDEPFMIDCKVYMKGLGEAWLIVGEK